LPPLFGLGPPTRPCGSGSSISPSLGVWTSRSSGPIIMPQSRITGCIKPVTPTRTLRHGCAAWLGICGPRDQQRADLQPRLSRSRPPHASATVIALNRGRSAAAGLSEPAGTGRAKTFRKAIPKTWMYARLARPAILRCCFRVQEYTVTSCFPYGWHPSLFGDRKRQGSPRMAKPSLSISASPRPNRRSRTRAGSWRLWPPGMAGRWLQRLRTPGSPAAQAGTSGRATTGCAAASRGASSILSRLGR
jgi:hypothetical protein